MPGSEALPPWGLGAGPFAPAPSGLSSHSEGLAAWAAEVGRSRSGVGASRQSTPRAWVAPALPGPPPLPIAGARVTDAFAPPPPTPPPISLIDLGDAAPAETQPSFGKPAGGGLASAVSERTFALLTADLEGRAVRELLPALLQAGAQAVVDAVLPALEAWLVPRIAKPVTAGTRERLSGSIVAAVTARLAASAPQAVAQALALETPLITRTACTVAAATAAALTHTLSQLPEGAHYGLLCAERGLYCPWAHASADVVRRRLLQSEAFAAYYAADASAKYVAGLAAQQAEAAAVGGSALARTAASGTGRWSRADRQRGWRFAAANVGANQSAGGVHRGPLPP